MDNLLRIVIVESDLNDAEKMISTLKSAGFAVRAARAADPDSLIEALKKHTPDLVLCTLGIPGLGLEQVVTTIREAGRHSPVIAITGNGQEEAVDAMRAGAVDMISKQNIEHFKLVATRTAECQRQWRQLKTYETSLREAEKRCRTLLNTSRDAIAYVHEGMHIYANDSYLELFGYTDGDEVEGTPIMDMVVSGDQSKMKEFLRGYEKNANDTQTLEIKLHDTHEQPFDAAIEFSPATIDGEPCTQIVIRNQANAKDLEEQLSYLSQRDLVTGLYNRQYFMEQLQNALGHAAQDGQQTSLLYVTIDKFNDIKISVGVSGADLVIADVGKVLDDVSGEGNIVARFEGENFAILTPTWERADLDTLTHKLLQSVSEHICDVEGKSVTCTVSIGVAQVDENTPDENELLVRAERATADATRAEGNQAVVYKPKEGEMSQKQLDAVWEERIRAAVKENRLRLLFQPIVSLHGDPGERYEVYLRMIDPDGQTIPPSEFMASAERTGLAKSLDRWVMLNAFKRLAEHRREHPETVFFIKLTAGSLQDPSMLPWVAEKLKELRMPAESLVFELKEAAVVSHLKQAKDLAKGFKQLRCQFSVDDFGTGLNPFQLLKHVSADYLKVDGSFMDSLPDNEENQEALRGLTDTAHSMNKLIIAQHVSDPNVLSVLFGMGINYIQGNFLQEPSEDLSYDFSSM